MPATCECKKPKPKPKPPKKKKKHKESKYTSQNVRKFAVTFQALIYIANAAIWVFAVLLLSWGFVIGLSNKTIQVDLMFLDLAVTTPGTTFIYYGVPLVFVATIGCFSSLAVTLFLTIFYIIGIIGFFLFDGLVGYGFLFKRDSFEQYWRLANTSLNGYCAPRPNILNMNASTKLKTADLKVGMFPINSTIFWEHLQSRGRCCGIKSWEDWRYSNYSKRGFDIPDSCCNDDYSYRYCGAGMFKHPDANQHTIANLVHSKGCMSIFPEALGLPQDSRIFYTGISVCLLLFLCLILSIVLLVFICTKKFRREQGLDNPDYVATRKPSRVSNHGDGGGCCGEGGKRQAMQFRNVKVHPEIDQRRGSTDSNKRVLFRERGPEFIHDEDRWGHKNNSREPTPNAHVQTLHEHRRTSQPPPTAPPDRRQIPYEPHERRASTGYDDRQGRRLSNSQDRRQSFDMEASRPRRNSREEPLPHERRASAGYDDRQGRRLSNSQDRRQSFESDPTREPHERRASTGYDDRQGRRLSNSQDRRQSFDMEASRPRRNSREEPLPHERRASAGYDDRQGRRLSNGQDRRQSLERDDSRPPRDPVEEYENERRRKWSF